MAGKKSAPSVTERFWAKVDFSGDCWEWQGALNHGYGQFTPETPGPKVLAHRFSYELLVGPIPKTLVIDHLCKNTACVNPDHLEPVSQAENVRRGYSPASRAARRTTCLHGHPYTSETTIVERDGSRRCLICKRAKWRRWRDKKLAAEVGAA